MDISKQLHAYEVEYHVLQDELQENVSPCDEGEPLEKLERANNHLKRQNMDLLEKLQVNNIGYKLMVESFLWFSQQRKIYCFKCVWEVFLLQDLVQLSSSLNYSHSLLLVIPLLSLSFLGLLLLHLHFLFPKISLPLSAIKSVGKICVFYWEVSSLSLISLLPYLESFKK